MRPRTLLSYSPRRSLAALLAGISTAIHPGPAVTQVPIAPSPATQNEPSITVLPNDVAVVGYNTDNSVGVSGFAVSAIGGGVWPNANVGIIPFRPPFKGAGDPAVDFNSRGQVFYATVGIDPIGPAPDSGSIFVARSLVPFPAAPPFWQPPVPVGLARAPCVFFDKPYISIDRISPAPPPNGSRDNIYVSLTRFAMGCTAQPPSTTPPPPRDDIQFSRSTNFGSLYERPVTISETLNPLRANDYRNESIPAAGPMNRVYVAWAETPNIEIPNPGVPSPGVIQLQRSTDEGRSFPRVVPGPAAPVQQVELLAELGNGSPMLHTTVPTMAVNTAGAFAGQVYIAFADRRDKQRDIFFTRDTGAGFPAMPVRINSAPDTLATDQFMPWMAVNSQGVIAVVFYSKLNNDTSLARVDAVCSADGGVSWTRDFTISGAQRIFTRAPGIGGQNRFGEYIGLATHDTTFSAAWTADNFPSIVQNIFTTKFTCPIEADHIAQPVAFDVKVSADQVIAIASSSTVAAAAFQSSTDMPGPEIVMADLPRRALLQSFELPVSR